MSTVTIPEEILKTVNEFRMNQAVKARFMEALNEMGAIQSKEYTIGGLRGIKIVVMESCPSDTIVLVSGNQLAGYFKLPPAEGANGHSELILFDPPPHPPYQGGYPRGDWTWDKVDCPGKSK
jgi:hypothetical protein